MALGLDYSGARPSHAAMRTAGFTFVCRYVGSQVRKAGRDAKWLSPSEAASLHADGFAIVVVFETAAQRADGGRAAGLADAHTAVAELAYCGLPAGTPVYFAVDWDAEVGPKIKAYFAAVAEVLGLKRVGCYGGYRVIKALLDAGLITYAWQTYAWSSGRWDPRNHIEQYSNNRSVGGREVDFDRSMRPDFGQWPAKGSTTTAPQEEDMAGRGGVIQSRSNVPNRRSELTLSVPNGTTSACGIYGDPTYDNPDAGYVKQPAGQFRVIAHFAGRAGVVMKDPNKASPTYDTSVVTVGFEADGKGWCDKAVLHLPAGKKADAWKIYRLDDGEDQYGADVS